ncbi:MAG: putative transporter, substrate-binding protein [Acidimicrobiaceae bacterium]|nr:putative transporter, substrate-binding protein [Acidimicrobiaceae bacterium]
MNKAKTRFALWTTSIVLCAALAVASGAVASASRVGRATSKSVNVELDWVPNPDHVALYYSLDKGYFSKNGLSVALHAPSNAADPVKLVGLNKVDLAISYESEMFYAQQSGLPVTAVSTLVPVPLNSLIVSSSDHVTQLSQMKGKKIGITGIPSDSAMVQMLLRTAHLTSSQVQTVNVGQNLIPSILSGKVDAIVGGYRNVEAIQIAQETGKKPTVFPASALGVPSYAELVVVANRNRLKSDPAYAAEVKSFLKGLEAGAAAAVANPASTTALMMKDTQYTPKFLKVSVPYTLTLIKPAAGQKFGCMNEANWQSFGTWMKSQKLISGTPNAAPLTSDAYLPYSC